VRTNEDAVNQDKPSAVLRVSAHRLVISDSILTLYITVLFHIVLFIYITVQKIFFWSKAGQLGLEEWL